MTPANWKTGNDVLVPFPIKADLSAMNKDSGEYYQLSWFLIFKRMISGNQQEETGQSDNRFDHL